jgi:D-glycerate 3-kinase
MSQTPPDLSELIARERLPADFADKALPTYRCIAAAVRARLQAAGRPIVVGVSGSQGSGKSTLVLFLEALLRAEGLAAARLSLDDLYLTHAERAELGRTVHPLLATRGVPGTHDVKLGLQVIGSLAREGDAAIPRFDKARDDRAPASEWPVFRGPAEVVLFEGWCVGARPEPDASLTEPINALEAERDPDGTWRRFVNEALKGAYRELFGRIDLLVAVRAPSFDCVLDWRIEQERKLAMSLGLDPERRTPSPGHRLMPDEEIRSFIAHYERITRRLIDELPGRADLLVQLAPDRAITSLSGPALRP